MSDDTDTAEIGDNRAAVLKDLVDRWVELEQEKKSLSDDRKEFVKEVKKKKLPVAEMVKLQGGDERFSKESIDALKLAGAILGKTVPVGDFDCTQMETELDQETIEFGQQRAQQIVEIDDQIDEVREHLKDHKQQVKDNGFNPKVVGLIVKFRLDPDKRADYTQTNVQLEAYENALGS